jgi:hypothetical protein
VLNNLNYSCFSESQENWLCLETFWRALHSIIYEAMENVNTKPYVLGSTTKFPILCFFTVLIILSCSFSNMVKWNKWCRCSFFHYSNLPFQQMLLYNMYIQVIFMASYWCLKLLQFSFKNKTNVIFPFLFNQGRMVFKPITGRKVMELPSVQLLSCAGNVAKCFVAIVLSKPQHRTLKIIVPIS